MSAAADISKLTARIRELLYIPIIVYVHIGVSRYRIPHKNIKFVFCKTFLHKIAKTFCRSLQLHFVGNCKPGWQSWYLPAI